MEYKLPAQFKPDRPISEGPWDTYVKRALAREPDVKLEDLTPTEQDLALISKMAYHRDELADNLAALIFEDRKVALQLEQGLAEGIAALNNPPKALVDFLDYYENMPDWTYMNALKANMSTEEGKAFLHAKRKPAQKSRFHQAFEDGARLTTGFFVGAYYPAVGQSIVTTGSVAKGSGRVIQTFKFFDDTSDVRDYMPFGKAIQAGAKVRLGHAFARRQIEKAGNWDKDYYGEIISDFDNMIFASGIIMGVNSIQAPEFRKYGVDPGKAMTYFLGAPRELLELRQAEIKRFFIMSVAHLDGSPETARQVYQAFKANEHYKPVNTAQDKFYKELTYFFANLLTRIAWGNKMAEEITMEKWFYGVPLAPLADYLSAQIHSKPSKASALIMKTTRQVLASRKSIPSVRLFRKPRRPTTQTVSAEPYQGSFGVFGKAKK